MLRPKSRVVRRELHWLIIGLGSCVLLWVFLSLAGEIAEGDTQAFDIMILKALRAPDDPSRLTAERNKSA
jgi:undecaprenyl-diphosphatase